MDRTILPRRRRGYDKDRVNMRLGEGEQWGDDQEPLSWRSSVARFAPVVGLVLVLIAACASAFAMLIWEPAAGPPASATPVAASSQSGRVQLGQALRVGNFAGGWEAKSLCSLIRAQKKGRLSGWTCQTRKALTGGRPDDFQICEVTRHLLQAKCTNSQAWDFDTLTGRDVDWSATFGLHAWQDSSRPQPTPA